MQYHWLNKNNNDNLILFFCGWGFDAKPFECLDCKNNDVLVLYDYTTLDFPLKLQEYNYQNIQLIAWSMGVWAAYNLREHLPQTSKRVAVNGTPFPIDDNFGIPHKMFDLTLKYAETGLRGKFYQNVFSDDELYKRYKNQPVERSISNCVKELVSLDKLIKSSRQTYDEKFYDFAIIGKHDKIIPSKNQLNCWKNLAITQECGHFPFYEFECWDEILQCK